MQRSRGFREGFEPANRFENLEGFLSDQAWHPLPLRTVILIIWRKTFQFFCI